MDETASITDAEANLAKRWSDIDAVAAASAVLGWDQETFMPAKGQAGRGRALATLAAIRHDLLTEPALSDAVDAAAEVAVDGSLLAAQAREARRHILRATAIPTGLARRTAEVRSRALASWQQARQDNDFGAFEPDLTDVVALARETADAYVAAGLADQPYDALLDEYEPGATEEDLLPLLSSLRDELSPLVRGAAAGGVVVDESAALGTFPMAAQLALGSGIASQMGYDFEAGRLDTSTHPFTTSFGVHDVRITWRGEDDDFRPGLFGIMHEVGHALYEQGLPEHYGGTPVGAAASLGIHESQSRLWENQVGRSRPFWEWALPHFKQAFPDKTDTTLAELWPALHTVVPSLIRVEADEATYNLHVVARFEIERALFAGGVSVTDLPELWDDTYEQLLGVRPPSAADGVLQDVHWSMGAFGYFPTYTLGNLIAAQLFATLSSELGDVDALMARGDFGPILGWLRKHVHSHGSRYLAADLVEQATGAPLSASHFLAYIRDTTTAVYG